MTLPLFPALKGVAWPVIRAPQWSTDTQVSTSGKRTTLGRYIFPTYGYTLTYEFLRSDATNKELQDLIGFYNTVGGARDLWQFNDQDDNTATTQLFGTGDGVTTAFQLTRTVSGNTFSSTDPVFSATVTTIFDNAVAKTPVTDYVVSATGLVTFTVAPAAAHLLTWTGTYTWLCRFNDDTNDFEKFMLNLYELKKIKFSTEKI